VRPDHDKELPYLPHQPAYTYHPNAPPQPNNMTALPEMKDQNGWVRPHGSAVEDEPAQGYVDDGRSFETGDSYDYTTTGQSPGGKGKFSGVRKLMKRRPVGS
jgi:hypothetical protein